MTKRPTLSFAELVAQVRDTPPPPEPALPRNPGLHGTDVRTHDGRWFGDLTDRDLPPFNHPVAGTIDPDDVTDAVAYALLVAGVPLVHDDCGSEGAMAPLTWFDPGLLSEYARTHPIARRKKDSLQWNLAREDSSGELHLVATYSMRWLDDAPR